MFNIGIIEDNTSLRITYEEFIKKDKELDLIFSCGSLNCLLPIINSNIKPPNFILLDLHLPGTSGLKIISILKVRYPNSNIIILTGDSSDNSIYDAILQGTVGYLLKPISIFDLKEYFNIINNGGSAISPYVANRIIDKLKMKLNDKALYLNPILTKRETEVINEIVKGLSYKEISNILNISYDTVNDHIKKIYQKMGVNSKVELVLKVKQY
jgi:DNA-binding NarL/FixJ family response regulator